MKYDALPNIPENWLEFLRGGMPFFPALGPVSAVVARADAVRCRSAERGVPQWHMEQDGRPGFERTKANAENLRQPDSVVVSTNLYPALFGGPAFQLFKCLTVIKLCEELSRHSVRAIPVCWISDETPSQFSRWSVRLLNSESELCLLEAEPRGLDDPLPRDAVATLLVRIEESAGGNCDPDTLEILRTSFGAGATLARASARLAAELMREWGIVALDPRSLDSGAAGLSASLPQGLASAYVAQCSILPVVATVIDPFEVDAFAIAQPHLKENMHISPIAWPQVSATVLDSRSRRILRRHGLGLSCLYAGADAVIGKIMNEMPRSAPGRLLALKAETEAKIAALDSLEPAGRAFARAVNSGKEKIVYQLDRLMANFEAASRNREQTIRRQIRTVCNLLAPDGGIQEREIGGIYLPLRYSPAVLRSLYDKMDIMNFEHQLITMD